MSYLGAAKCIISTAQHAKPKVKGQIEPCKKEQIGHDITIVQHYGFLITYYNNIIVQKFCENIIKLKIYMVFFSIF